MIDLFDFVDEDKDVTSKKEILVNNQKFTCKRTDPYGHWSIVSTARELEGVYTSVDECEKRIKGYLGTIENPKPHISELTRKKPKAPTLEEILNTPIAVKN